jgi:2-hydroxy-3-oxopropionate reductase
MSSISPIATKDLPRDQRAGLRLPRCAGLGRRGRRQGGDADDHGRRPRRRRSPAPSRCSRRWARTSPMSGRNGAGQTCKVANQIIVALNIQAVARRWCSPRRPAPIPRRCAGADGRLRVVAHPGGACRAHAERHVQPGLPHPLHQKDLNLALSAAKELGLALPNTAIAQQMFSSCAAHGGGELDHSALVLAIEGMAAHSLRDRHNGRVRNGTSRIR